MRNKMMKTQLAPFHKKNTMGPPQQPSTSNESLNRFQLPEEILCCIAAHVPPKDRLMLQLVCRRFKTLFAQWPDITSIEIRSQVYDCLDSSATTPVSIFQFGSKVPRISFLVKLTDITGKTHQMQTNQDRTSIQMLKQLLLRLTKLEQLTIWDACLGAEFASTISKLTTVTQLRLWNCSKYFEKKTRNKKLTHTLMSLPNLDELLILDMNASASNAASCTAYFDKACAQKLSSCIRNLQLTGLHLPLSAFQAIVDRLANSCTRLAIGCTFGKEQKRIDYLKALMEMKHVSDLDLPPFIFHLNELPVPDGVVEKLLNDLPLKSFGFRHYNSSVLFRFIEHQLPVKIRVLRIHHNANRIPNFSALGQQDPEEVVVKKKSSVISHYSHYSILSASRSSISSTNAIDTARVVAQGAQGSSSGSGTRDSALASSLAARRLTIFALAEDTKNNRNRKIKQKCYFGVDVFYLYETKATQEVFGRIAAPTKSPHVYSKNLKKDSKVRIIKGDLVKPIPLSSLGLESDYELSDCDD